MLSLIGCSTLNSPQPEEISEAKLKHAVKLANSSLLKQKLLSQYSEWKGSPYQLGGLSKSGIDCSGFVYLTFKSKLGVSLPRTTERQAELGLRIAKKQLRIGDLIFFKTGLFQRHVGIYLGDSRFLHASTSQGVTISNLQNNYWASNYWFSTRVKSN
ncbi:NlpC/P60 family protein [Thalassotalea sp. ND16A]|uniref:NlpC/P60 family protein n=1 Tax=Thalassotalea sp. ND16A TaxID=1535422 RepID=UPI00126A6A67|nr:NlpC/P60 family protein [Thalassotalea sp. ND16A]